MVKCFRQKRGEKNGIGKFGISKFDVELELACLLSSSPFDFLSILQL